jgi:hypothetical protein
MAEGEGGAGQAWTKGAAAQKGHASKRSPGLTHEPPHPPLTLKWIPIVRYV